MPSFNTRTELHAQHDSTYSTSPGLSGPRPDLTRDKPSDNFPPLPAWLRSGHVRPAAYCAGFMTGLSGNLDEVQFADVLEPVFEPTAQHLNERLLGVDHSAFASMFVRGLYDGLREYSRLSDCPDLMSGWAGYMATISGLIESARTQGAA